MMMLGNEFGLCSFVCPQAIELELKQISISAKNTNPVDGVFCFIEEQPLNGIQLFGAGPGFVEIWLVRSNPMFYVVET